MRRQLLARGARLPLPVARALARTPLLAEEERIAVARRSASGHLERLDVEAADEEIRAVLQRVQRPRARADLLYEFVAEALSFGLESGLLNQAVEAQLRLADQRFTRGRVRPAARSFARATELAFDRSISFDSTTAPIARDARVFTAPFGESAFARALRAPRGRSSSAPAPSGGDIRVLFATRGNANFLNEMVALLEEHPQVTPRYVDLADRREMARGIHNPALVAEEIITGNQGMASRVDQVLRPYLTEADILFVDWCSALAVLVGLVDPGETRLVVRLHSFEAFTRWPHLLDFSRIDDMVFVSEHLRDFAVDAIPGLGEENAPRLHVLPLGKNLQQYVRPKRDEARFNVGLVGWGAVAKDPLWAFELIRRLRVYDDRYRLLLVGTDFIGDSSAAASRYADRLATELAELEQTGGVRKLGPSDDVPSVLTEVGVVLSSSVRESFHAALVEGAASGAVPVVRDWPFFAGRPTGVRSLVPSDWVVETPGQAARRILETTADPDVWRRTGATAAEHALATWDWEAVRPAYERFLRG